MATSSTKGLQKVSKRQIFDESKALTFKFFDIDTFHNNILALKCFVYWLYWNNSFKDVQIHRALHLRGLELKSLKTPILDQNTLDTYINFMSNNINGSSKF